MKSLQSCPLKSDVDRIKNFVGLMFKYCFKAVDILPAPVTEIFLIFYRHKNLDYFQEHSGYFSVTGYGNIFDILPSYFGAPP